MFISYIFLYNSVASDARNIFKICTAAAQHL